MNILPFVLAILLIFAYTGAASLQKYYGSTKAQSAYIGLRDAERKMLRKTERKKFETIPGTPTVEKKEAKERRAATEQPLVIPETNPLCARLNLFPLINEGREVHPELYNVAIKLLQTFYAGQMADPSMANRFLDSIIASAKTQIKDQEVFALETLQLNDAEFQPLYYRLLKGTKHADLFSAKGYPPLIEYFKVERQASQICLFHAHPHILASFFGTKTALKMYKIVHKENQAGFELEALLGLVGDAHLRFTPPEVWKLFDLKKPRHSSMQGETLVAEDKTTGISVRKFKS